MKKNRNQLWCAAGSPAIWTAEYLLALFGVYFWAIYVFGISDVNRILALSFSASMVLSLCLQMAFRHRIDLRKLLGAAVNGFLLGFLMPADIPFWAIVLVVAVATIPFDLPIISKYISRYVHPIALAMVFMMFVLPQFKAENGHCLINVPAPLPPLDSLLSGSIPDEGIYDLLLGRHSGRIGEISVLMIVIGGAYLVVRKTIRFYAPVAMLGSLAILSYVFPVTGSALDFLVAQMFTGGVFFTAVFLLAYFPCAPATCSGNVVYGLICGVLTYALRRFFPSFDGVYLALLLSTAIIAVVEPLMTPQVILWKKEF